MFHQSDSVLVKNEVFKLKLVAPLKSKINADDYYGICMLVMIFCNDTQLLARHPFQKVIQNDDLIEIYKIHTLNLLCECVWNRFLCKLHAYDAQKHVQT